MTIEEELALIAQNRSPAPQGAPPAVAAVEEPAPAVDAPAVDAPAAPPPNPFTPPEVPLDQGAPWTPDPEGSNFWASWTKESITGGGATVWAGDQRRTLMLQMLQALPKDAAARVLARQSPAARPSPRNWDTLQAPILEEAAKIIATDPKAWGDLPLTQDQFEARLIADDKATLVDAQALLDRDGGAIAEFFGAAAREITRPINIATLPFGGTLKYGYKGLIAAEAAIAGATSAAGLPAQYAAAERLDLPNPNGVQQVATDAVIGGAFAGALAKGISWLTGRTRTTIEARPDGASPLEFDANVDAAEAALTGNRTVADETQPQFTLPPGDVPYNEAAVLRSIIGVESGGRANAQNPNSSARGLGQFISSTWLTMIQKYRPDLTTGRSANEILALRDDPNVNAEMTAMYTRENHARLTAEGLPANPGELYMAHFMGPGGAVSALRAAPNTPLSTIMSPAAMTANAGIRFGGKRFADFTTGDLRRWAAHKMRAAYDPNASSDLPTFTGEGTTRGYTGSGQVNVGNEFRIDVDYEVVDYLSLIRASGDMQPRDRSGANSDEQVAFIAAHLDPALLMPSPSAATGAPIVGPDDVIESGNGRVMGIGRAYERHPERAQAYRQMIVDQGYTIPEGVTRPVLIARRKTPIAEGDTARYGAATQNSGVAQMTPAEQARITARGLQSAELGRLDLSRPLSAPENRNFVRSVMAGLPLEVRNGYFDPTSDNLNAYGQRHLREALFSRAWPDPDIMAAYIGGDAGELKSLLEALEMAAPRWAALRIEVEAGRVPPEFDISVYVLDAMRLIVAARQVAGRQSQTVTAALNDILDQPSILDGAVSPLTTALVRKFWPGNRPASADQVADFLGRYADAARAVGQDNGMFDAPTPRDVLQGLDRATFADLPENFGRARGASTPADRTPPAAALPEDAFTDGATSPDAEAVQAQIRSDLEDTAADEGLIALVRSGASLDDIAAHPKVAAALADLASRPLTSDQPGYGLDAFWAARQYRAGDQVLAGRAAATDHLHDAARAMAWTDEGLAVPANAIRKERTATILIGPPAAGKSTIANPLARHMGAAIIDADEAKKLIPEYERGIGSNAVHEESSELIDEVLARAVIAGENMVLPKVGGSVGSIEALAEKLARNGYMVNLVLADVPGDVALQRMIGRFVATGRIIPLDIMNKGIDGAANTYQMLKARSFINAYSHIDNTPGIGQPRRIIEDPAEILPADTRGHGADRNGQPGPRVQQSGPEAVRPAGTAEQTPTPGLTVTADPIMDQAAIDAFDAASAIDAARAGLGAFTIDMPDGTRLTFAEALDDLDLDADTDFQITFCTTNGGTA